MIFSCSASSDGNGYPLELQVFERAEDSRSFTLISRAEVNLQDEQCQSQPVSFNVSLPFCEGDRVGMYVPNLAGLTGLGYRDTFNIFDAYADRTVQTPPSVDETVSVSNSLRAVPLVSIEGMYVCVYHMQIVTCLPVAI